MSTKPETLLDAIGLVDDEFILEAHGDEAELQNESSLQATAQPAEAKPRARAKKSTQHILALAACLVLAAGVGLVAVLNKPNPVASETASSTSVSTDAKHEKAESADSYAAEAGAKADAVVTNRSDSTTPPATGHSNTDTAGEAFVLTAGVWNDNENWPFFCNLVNAGKISFPVFGLDPTQRIKVSVTDAAGNALRNEDVTLTDESGTALWHAKTDKNGSAYMFFRTGQTPVAVTSCGVSKGLTVSEPDPTNQQGTPVTHVIDDITITVGSTANTAISDLQVMFIVDTTGSMSDEIAYLQKDFASIAEAVGSDGVSYSANFYRDEGDEYVTKCNSFTPSVETVQSQLNGEYAKGGGDTPEAVADILAQTITNNNEWRPEAAKVAFLIFDAPPHDGTDTLLDEAVRSAAERGIQVVPVVASNADRSTELFGRALAIYTNGTYVFLTDDSGVGNTHLEPIVGDYTVEKLHDVVVRIITNLR